MKKFLITLFLIWINSLYASDESSTSAYFNQVRTNPQALRIFVNEMPKGAELHLHLSGAVYAENILKYAQNDDLCLNPQDFTLSSSIHCPTSYRLNQIVNNLNLSTQVVNAWSLANYIPSNAVPAPNHFFDTFLKALPAVNPHRGEILAEVVQRAANEHLDYVELMILPKTKEIMTLGQQLDPRVNFPAWVKQLHILGIDNQVKAISAQVSSWEKIKNQRLNCHDPQAQSGCRVLISYQVIAIRTFEPSIVFTQLYAAFLAASHDPRIVGINLVGPEQDPLALRDYSLHMKMIAYLHTLFPGVHIALHAGELVGGLVPPEDLRFHISEALHVAGAERIGHGSDIAYEANATGLLSYMAQHHIPIELALTSNLRLLGLIKDTGPLMLYWKAGVPVTLNTDDEGVFRTDLNQEYLLAIQWYPLTYQDIKRLTRNSLSYSFERGHSLWQENSDRAVPDCTSSIERHELNSDCKRFLDKNPKATLQWNLEKEWWNFEKNIASENRAGV